MKRFLLRSALLAATTSLFGLMVGCASGGGGDCEVCVTAGECSRGDTCVDSCCAPFVGCTVSGCAPGLFCDSDDSCKDTATKCRGGNCECFVVNSAGQLIAPVSEDVLPDLTVTSNGRVEVQALLASKGLRGDVSGEPIPSRNYTLELTGDAADEAFEIVVDEDTGLQYVAGIGTTPASATVVATFADADGGSSHYATCSARVAHLGAPSAAEAVRVFVYNDADGTPVSQARVIVDANNDGVDDGWAAAYGRTSVAGTATTELGVTGLYSVSVFHQDYNYVSVAGLTAEQVRDLAIPLSLRPTETAESAGGFTGDYAYDLYRQKVARGTIRGGLVASSLPLQSLFNFNLDTLIGPMGDVECGELDTPAPRGCYDLDFGSSIQFRAPLPGGVVAEAGDKVAKNFFDVVGMPGRRHGWSLGTALDLLAYPDLLGVVFPLVMPKDGKTADLASLDFGKLVTLAMPLIPDIAMGVRGNLPLRSAALEDWKQYTEKNYKGRGDSDLFPKLTTAARNQPVNRGPFDSHYGMRTITDYAMPALPADPAVQDQAMEGFLVVTGVDTRGYGFVPMGFGLGLDCTAEDCLSSRSGYDGRVNGLTLCSKADQCVKGMRRRVDDGHVAMFRASPPGAYADEEWVTLAMAAPISALINDAKNFRASIVVHREGRCNPDQGESCSQVRGPAAGASDALATADFPPFADWPAQVTDRHLRPNPGADSDVNERIHVHYLTTSSETAEDGEVATRWNMFVAGDVSGFVAPKIPNDGVDDDKKWPDPMAPARGLRDRPAGTLNLTQLGFRLREGMTLEALAGNDGALLGDVTKVVDAFTVRTGEVAAVEN